MRRLYAFCQQPATISLADSRPKFEDTTFIVFSAPLCPCVSFMPDESHTEARARAASGNGTEAGESLLWFSPPLRSWAWHSLGQGAVVASRSGGSGSQRSRSNGRRPGALSRDDYFGPRRSELLHRCPRGVPRYGFPIASPLNWRLPTYAWLLSRLPNQCWIQAVLLLLAVGGMWLAFVAESRRAVLARRG